MISFKRLLIACLVLSCATFSMNAMRQPGLTERKQSRMTQYVFQQANERLGLTPLDLTLPNLKYSLGLLCNQLCGKTETGEADSVDSNSEEDFKQEYDQNGEELCQILYEKFKANNEATNIKSLAPPGLNLEQTRKLLEPEISQINLIGNRILKKDYAKFLQSCNTKIVTIDMVYKQKEKYQTQLQVQPIIYKIYNFIKNALNQANISYAPSHAISQFANEAYNNFCIYSEITKLARENTYESKNIAVNIFLRWYNKRQVIQNEHK